MTTRLENALLPDWYNVINEYDLPESELSFNSKHIRVNAKGAPKIVTLERQEYPFFSFYDGSTEPYRYFVVVELIPEDNGTMYILRKKL